MSEEKKIEGFGARKLNDVEIQKILSTYERILQQIERMRKQRNENSQKLNNIGILGARGTGKTSVLKTIENKLKNDDRNQEKKRNILLPMIVPENMSPSMNLMSSVLGLFQGVVDEISKNDQGKNCWEEKSTVKNSYQELLKRYCFVQPDYRDILVRNFTTENEYAKNSGKVFNSDIEFRESFSQLIEDILKSGEYSEDAMFFLFIDDIDLSTVRCMDVVKTLLSYLSHPRIITFVSGDLDTFEEALTLDFLRQEKSLNEQIFNVAFGPDNKLLDRKKRLSYEYLKKILPPAYRHNVKKWSIAQRGDYIICDENGKGETLAQRLEALFANDRYHCQGYFQYAEERDTKGTAKEHDVQGTAEEGGVQGTSKKAEENYDIHNLPQVYHIFDQTARGLNNVYQVLGQLREDLNWKLPDDADEQERKKKQEQAFGAVKMVLETIISSKPILNMKRDLLLNHVLIFGENFEDTEIKVENLNLCMKKENEEENKTLGSLEVEPIEYFTLYLFVDFAARLLGHKNGAEDVRQKIVLALLNYPEISDELLAISEKIEEKTLIEIQEERKKVKKVKNGNKTNTEKSIKVFESELTELLFRGELVFGLQYLQFGKISFQEINGVLRKEFPNKTSEPKDIDIDDAKYHANANSVIKSIGNMYKNDETNIYSFLDKLLPSAIKILQIYDNYSTEDDGYLYMKHFGDGSNIFDETSTGGGHKNKFDINKYKNNSYVFINYLAEALKNQKEKLETENLNGEVSNETYRRRWEYVRQISKNNLWDMEEISAIIHKITDKKEEIVKRKKTNNVNVVLSEDFVKKYNEIKDKNVTISWGGFDKLKENLKNVLNNINPQDGKEIKISLSDYLEIVGSMQNPVTVSSEGTMTIKGFLANSRLHEGREYVVQLYNKCNSTKIEADLFEDEEVTWLLCYLEYAKAMETDDSTKQISRNIVELTKVLSEMMETTKVEVEQDTLKTLQVSYEELCQCFDIKPR